MKKSEYEELYHRIYNDSFKMNTKRLKEALDEDLHYTIEKKFVKFRDQIKREQDQFDYRLDSKSQTIRNDYFKESHDKFKSRYNEYTHDYIWYFLKEDLVVLKKKFKTKKTQDREDILVYSDEKIIEHFARYDSVSKIYEHLCAVRPNNHDSVDTIIARLLEIKSIENNFRTADPILNSNVQKKVKTRLLKSDNSILLDFLTNPTEKIKTTIEQYTKLNNRGLAALCVVLELHKCKPFSHVVRAFEKQFNVKIKRQNFEYHVKLYRDAQKSDVKAIEREKLRDLIKEQNQT